MIIDVSHDLSSLSTAELGKLGEDLAARYLRRAGYAILCRNWRVRYGEIDIVAAVEGVIVVVEVKTRRSTYAGVPAAAVTAAKARRLRQLAGAWMGQNSPRSRGLRIDVIALEATGPRSLRLEHIRSAA
ncbi:YraN family protein [Nanchangia anserum]|uniref:UPF0102 protein H8R10_01920 n=1 Tax=Nanchangia anserum TaxID=2692125 RepID=A0A8I0GBJ1_9ACTO|nr:YraN family protein [Nanchangia anserum]MBD3688991.1 YraN family protein [Nanchangia anserum]